MRDVEDLLAFSRWFVLTGAGCSTKSGIPAYRDEHGVWQHKAPIQLKDFIRDAAVRRRYWARSLVGYHRVRGAAPNDAHHALAALEASEVIELLVTQNVDGLHERAGSKRVVALHGRIGDVVCLRCSARHSRDEIQDELFALNPQIRGTGALSAPDGDAHLEPGKLEHFRMVDCFSCGGLLKPDVVFYGETVPPNRVAECYAGLERADVLVVVGSSLTVFSGFRFVKQASARGVPVVVLNQGATRADTLAALKVDVECGAVLSRLAALRDGRAHRGSARQSRPPRNETG